MADGGANADDTRYTPAARSSCAPRQHERLEPLERSSQLVALDRAGRVDMLRAHLRALAHERAPPDPVVLRQDLQSLVAPFVTRVEVVALRQRDRRRSDERRLQAIDRTRRVAQHAVDAHAELLELVELVGRLQILALRYRLLMVTDDPRLHPNELPHEVADLHDEIADDGEIPERLDADGATGILGQERLAGELRLAVHGHPAAAAHAHAARPAKRQRPVQSILDVVQPIEHDPVLGTRHLVLLQRLDAFFLRAVARYLDGDHVRHRFYLP